MHIFFILKLASAFLKQAFLDLYFIKLINNNVQQNFSKKEKKNNVQQRWISSTEIIVNDIYIKEIEFQLTLQQRISKGEGKHLLAR